MEQLSVGEDLARILEQLIEPTEVMDSSGALIGIFTPQSPDQEQFRT